MATKNDSERVPSLNSFDLYARRFRTAALRRGYNDEYSSTCLAYAENLWKNKLPIIFDWSHFSTLVGISNTYLYSAANFGERHYRKFKIPKKTGGEREISEPLPTLKMIQRYIHDEILSKVPVHIAAKGFVGGVSLKSHANLHLRQHLVIRVDIEDFFGSIFYPRVMGIYKSLGYSQEVANLLASLSTLRARLPQGAPTSPCLSNLVCRTLDSKIFAWAQQHGLRYSRYADDLILSGYRRAKDSSIEANPTSLSAGQIIEFLDEVIQSQGFKINTKKTNVMNAARRQLVTGIVVNSGARVPRSIRNTIRAEVHAIKKFGLESHLSFKEIDRRNYISALIGRVGYICYVNRKDKWAKEALQFLKSIKEAT